MTYCEVISKWQSYDINKPSAIDKYLHNFRILFAYNSGKIENDEIDYYDTREIFESGKVSSFTGNVRTIFEQQNQRDCYEVLKPKIAAREPLSIELVKRIHFELCKGTYDDRRYLENEEKPGEFKKHDYIVGKTEVGSNAEEVETDLSELLGELNEYSNGDTLKAAAYLHANFENIHPFADGNGRVGRTLMNYYLMINGHPPIIIYEEDRKDYYKALEAFDEKIDIEMLYEFLKAQCVKTWTGKL